MGERKTTHIHGCREIMGFCFHKPIKAAVRLVVERDCRKIINHPAIMAAIGLDLCLFCYCTF